MSNIPKWFGPALATAIHQDEMARWSWWARKLHRIFISKSCPCCRAIRNRASVARKNEKGYFSHVVEDAFGAYTPSVCKAHAILALIDKPMNEALDRELEKARMEGSNNERRSIGKVIEIITEGNPGAAQNAVREDYPEIAELLDKVLDREIELAVAEARLEEAQSWYIPGAHDRSRIIFLAAEVARLKAEGK